MWDLVKNYPNQIDGLCEANICTICLPKSTVANFCLINENGKMFNLAGMVNLKLNHQGISIRIISQGFSMGIGIIISTSRIILLLASFQNIIFKGKLF